MFSEAWLVFSAASWTFRLISDVDALCSVTAEAIVPEFPSIASIVRDTSAIREATALAADTTASTFAVTSSVAFEVCVARFLTSLATTAKPLPASPARAASIVAFSANRLVCDAMS
jgi:hypothetical protein